MTSLKQIKKLRKQLNIKPHSDGFICDKHNRAIIDVGAENYDDIYSPYCYKGGDTLASEIVNYLERKSNTIPIEYDLSIRFHVKNASEEKRKDIESAVKENYRNEVRVMDKNLFNAYKYSIIFILVGILFSTLYLTTVDIFPEAVSYFVDIIAWVFLWEGVYLFFLNRHSIQLQRLKAYRLGTAKIEIVEFENY